MKKTYLLLFALIFCSNITNAQNYTGHKNTIQHKLGVVAGANFNVSAKPDVGTKNKIRPGFLVGGKYELHFWNGFYTDATMLFTLKSFRFDSRISAEYVQRNMFNIEIPIHLGYRYKINEKVAVFGSAGPYFGFGIYGFWKQKLEIHNKPGHNIHNVDLYKKNSGDYRGEFGLGYKLGVELFNHYQFMMGYDWGMTNLNKYYHKMRNRNLHLSVAYLF